MAIGAGRMKLGGLVIGALGMPMEISAGLGALLGGGAAGLLGSLLSGGDQTTTTTTQAQLPPKVQAQLDRIIGLTNELDRLGISAGGTQLANQQLEALLSGEISPGFQDLITKTFQQTAAPLLARASATGNFGGSDFQNLLGGISGDISTSLFQQALGAARQAPQSRIQNLLAPILAAQGTGTSTSTQTTPLQGGNLFLGGLGGAATGLGLLGAFNKANE